jgi:hypothetical protein
MEATRPDFEIQPLWGASQCQTADAGAWIRWTWPNGIGGLAARAAICPAIGLAVEASHRCIRRSKDPGAPETVLSVMPQPKSGRCKGGPWEACLPLRAVADKPPSAHAGRRLEPLRRVLLYPPLKGVSDGVFRTDSWSVTLQSSARRGTFSENAPAVPSQRAWHPDPAEKPPPKEAAMNYAKLDSDVPCQTAPGKSADRQTLRKRLLEMILRNEASRRPGPRQASASRAPKVPR